MQRADLTTRTIAAFVDLLLVVGLAKLPEGFGFLIAAGYILFRDGLFNGRSVGKKLIGLRTVSAENADVPITYRESIMRNVTYAIAFIVFWVPYAGWVLCPLVLGVEALTALGDDRGMRIGDMVARTTVVPTAPASQNITEGTE